MNDQFKPIPKDIANQNVASIAKWVLDNPISVSSNPNLVMTNVACNSEWDEHAELVIASQSFATKLHKAGQRILSATLDEEKTDSSSQEVTFEGVTSGYTPCLLFLKDSEDSDVSVEDLKELAAQAEKPDFNPDNIEGDIIRLLKLDMLRIVDGTVYEASDDASDFGDTSWRNPESKVSAYHNILTVHYHSAHTNDELWYTLDIKSAE